MTADELLRFKQEVFAACTHLLQERMEHARKAMLQAQDSANSEEKSSAGDKYETGRAMSQIERDRNAKQLAQAQNELSQLQRIDVTALRQQAATGALIFSSDSIYFIAVGLGVVDAGGKKVIVLSPASPLAQALAGKKPKDIVTFNGKQLQLTRIG